MRKDVFGVLLFFYLSFNEAAAADLDRRRFYRDPFEPQLPQVTDEGQKELEFVAPQKDVFPPRVNIEGILWAGEYSRVIIDGEVYKTGETITSVGAEVHKIEKNTVFILYQGKLFEMGIIKKDIGKLEAK